jgi:hypothetical protein
VWRIVEIKYEKNILSSINKWLYTYKKKKEKLVRALAIQKKKLTPKTLFLILSNTHHHPIHAKALSKKIR